MQNEKPILFNTEMVKAVLDGRKTQTRRVIKPQPTYDGEIYSSGLVGPEMYEPVAYDKHGEMIPGKEIFGVYTDDGEWGIKCPYGQVGDRLWVRETTCITPKKWGASDSSCIPDKEGDMRFVSYKADGHPEDAMREYKLKWKPSIHMPRWASRINLEITDIRVERVRDINPLSSLAEGCKWEKGNGPSVNFKKLWNSINEKRGFGWDVNPWVWVVEFKVL